MTLATHGGWHEAVVCVRMPDGALIEFFSQA
jgi:hypothetical protein